MRSTQSPIYPACPLTCWKKTCRSTYKSPTVLPQPRNPRHGITLEQMLAALVERIGCEAMGVAVPIRCFTHDPSIASSLKFLRRTPWARAKVEELYLQGLAGR